MPDPETLDEVRPKRHWFARVEWKPQDCWVGIFWRREGDTEFNLWVCLIPMVPLHVGWSIHLSGEADCRPLSAGTQAEPEVDRGDVRKGAAVGRGPAPKVPPPPARLRVRHNGYHDACRRYDLLRDPKTGRIDCGYCGATDLVSEKEAVDAG